LVIANHEVNLRVEQPALRGVKLLRTMTVVFNDSECICVCVTVPTVKMPRMLVTSAYALQQLLKKTELIGQSATQVSP